MWLEIFKWSCSLFFVILHACLWLVVGSGTTLVHNVFGRIEYRIGTRYIIGLDTTPGMILKILFPFLERNHICDYDSMRGANICIMIIWNIFYALVDSWHIMRMWLVIDDMCIIMDYYFVVNCLSSQSCIGWYILLVHGGFCTITALFFFLVECSELSND